VKIGESCSEIFGKKDHFLLFDTGIQMSRDLRSYWTKVHQILTRYSQVNCAVKLPIDIVMFLSVLECQGDEWRWVSQFCTKIGYHGNVPWASGKRRSDLLSTLEYLSFGENLAKIGPVDPEISGFEMIITK